MKKIIGALMICTLLLTGCSSIAPQNNKEDEKKQSKIEVYYAQDDKLLKTIDNQEIVHKLLETYNWETMESLSNELIPEYKLLVYQEKTLLFGQDPNKEREYELIETVITFQDSPYVAEVISSDVIKSVTISENTLASYYTMPDDTIRELHKLLSK